MLKVELEAAQRKLEGKDEALKILQSMVGVVQRSFAYLLVKEGSKIFLPLFLVKPPKPCSPSKAII